MPHKRPRQPYLYDFMSNRFHTQRGFVGLYLTIVVLILMLGIITSIGFGVLAQQHIMQNIVQSAQAYAAAESGIEDVLIRLVNGQNVCNPPGSPPCSSTLLVSSASADIAISDIVAGARTITAEGDSLDRFRTVQVVYEISSITPGFFYGAQVGDLGIEMENNSGIMGNVFSNGDFEMVNNASTTGTVKISGAGGLNGGKITGDAYVDACTSSAVTGILHANTQTGCSFASLTNSDLPIVPIPLPLSAATIDEWKNDAEAGGITVGDYNRSSGSSSLGPQKIVGNMTIQNSAQLILTGTVWVTGNVIIKNDARVQLDSGYGSTSGALIANGSITLENNSISSGSGAAGSYLMYLSTTSVDPAITIKNNAIVDILYASNQFVQVENNAAMREITGNGLRIKNNATVTYEIGLQDAAFTSGPGGGWTVTSWKEIE